jgi:hypothetical protein
MVLSEGQLSGIAQALDNHQHTLKFIQKSKSEQKQDYDEFNYIKNLEIDEFVSELFPVALNIRDEIYERIDKWVAKKTNAIFTQSLDDNHEFDEDDVIFLAGIAALVNLAVYEQYPDEQILKRITHSYENAATFYTSREWNTILNYLEDKGYSVIRTGDQVSISTPKHYPVKTTVRVTPPPPTQFSFTNPAINEYYANYTLKSFRNIGEKYYSVMKTSLIDGYENGLTVNQIAENLRVIVDPEDSANNTFYIYRRIAHGESSFYTETAKTDSYKSLYIQRVMYLTAGDSDVCPLCLPDHLRIFLITELLDPPPRHNWCRCTLLPVYDPINLIAFLIPAIYSLLLLYEDDDDEST